MINQFMKENLIAIQSIINNLSRPFDSHEFIRAFSSEFQTSYVLFLTQYNVDPFQKVNIQIARFLSENQTILNISAQGKVLSPNIFGNNTENEQWI